VLTPGSKEYGGEEGGHVAEDGARASVMARKREYWKGRGVGTGWSVWARFEGV
jgi:hypothetical protein